MSINTPTPEDAKLQKVVLETVETESMLMALGASVETFLPLLDELCTVVPYRPTHGIFSQFPPLSVALSPLAYDTLSRERRDMRLLHPLDYLQRSLRHPAHPSGNLFGCLIERRDSLRLDDWRLIVSPRDFAEHPDDRHTAGNQVADLTVLCDLLQRYHGPREMSKMERCVQGWYPLQWYKILGGHLDKLIHGVGKSRVEAVRLHPALAGIMGTFPDDAMEERRSHAAPTNQLYGFPLEACAETNLRVQQTVFPLEYRFVVNVG